MPQQIRTVMVITTTAKRTEALKLARAIVQARLAACVQLLPIHSVYRWKGKVESQDETLLLAKTTKAAAARLRAFIRANHTYAVPEIVQLSITAGLPAYLRWIAAETSPCSCDPTHG